MYIFKEVKDYRAFYSSQKTSVSTWGFVPTMGALHQGHLSLIKKAKAENEKVVCSIFVNPTQFNDPTDFQKYPVTLDKDIEMLVNAGCDILFLPSVKEIYPNGTVPQHTYQLGYLETVLEGQYRPGHFQGVCQVVDRLLRITEPDKMYIGQKDYQQCMVLSWLVRELKLPVEVNICPTLRESNGLAMSSRNLRLSATDRVLAAAIHDTLLYIQKNLKPGEISNLRKVATDQLTVKGFRVEYIEFANADTLQLTDLWAPGEPLVVLIAAYLGEIRLIDNMIIA